MNYLTTAKKYIRIYFLFFAQALKTSMAYRAAFILGALVDLGYSFWLIAFFSIIYSNIQSIADWSYSEMLFLTGLNVVTSNVFLSAVHIMNLFRLPRKIIEGEVDLIITKPINEIFMLSLGTPAIGSLVATIPGFYLMYQGWVGAEVTFSFLSTILAIVSLISGFLISYAIGIGISSLAFKYPSNNYDIPLISANIVTEYKQYPAAVYRGVFRYVFLLVVPVVHLSGIPAKILLKGATNLEILSGPVLAIIFMYFGIKVWNSMVKNYSSASS